MELEEQAMYVCVLASVLLAARSRLKDTHIPLIMHHDS
jgi:hypothetical protein